VNANCARAKPTASQLSNIRIIRRCWSGGYHARCRDGIAAAPLAGRQAESLSNKHDAYQREPALN
jgi:hypothetical protein